MARSNSTSRLAAAGADQDVDMSDALSDPVVTLPDKVFAGLLGRSLALRLLGYTAPAAAHPAEAARGLRLRAGAHQITKPLAPQCEDAHFVGERALGVADGVGGMVQFKEYGVDSAKYSAGLMRSAHSALRRHEESSVDSFLSMASPQAAAQLSLAAVAAADGEAAAFGGATITVLTLLGATIGVANLGDSGFMVLRLGENGFFVVKRSKEQQHGFNFPFQLTNFPPALAQRFAQLQVDRASSCDLYTCDVRVGDLVLLYSDGLSDNVYEREVLEIAGCALSPAVADLLGLPGHATPPENVAKALADAAHLRSQDERASVPFTDYSWRFGYDFPGGKEDDITVVAAWVVPDACI